jgi:hypothetical protein
MAGGIGNDVYLGQTQHSDELENTGATRTLRLGINDPALTWINAAGSAQSWTVPRPR